MTITPDLFKLTQCERILTLLKRRGGMGVMVYEITAPRPEGLGVAQYNARIKELRARGHNIKNVTPGHFVLKSNHPAWSVPTTPSELKGEAKKQWNAVGAYLRGEGPRPNIEPNLEQQVQETLW